jgi:hypothetical protein
MNDCTRSLLRSVALMVLAATAASCGFLPISRMSRTGAEQLESAAKPTPVDSAFGNCGPVGSQPDYVLNARKNRVDEGAWLDTPWSMLARLPWPRTVGYRFRNQWTEGERDEVARYEGAPVRVEGYLQGFKLEGREPTNCYSDDPAQRDYHLWMAEEPGGARKRSIVIEITPRVRAKHSAWTEARLDALVATQARILVSGWLMLDQMHPERVGVNRITLWEVHPIAQIDVQEFGRWVSLDSLPDAWPSTVMQTARPAVPAPTSPRPR